MDIYFNRSTNLGLTWLAVDTRLDSGDAPGASDSLSPQIATSGSTVIVVWEDNRQGFGSWEIFANPSPDGGLTWAGSDTLLSLTTTANDSPVP